MTTKAPEVVAIQYDGAIAICHPALGEWSPGEVRELLESDEVESLLVRPDFSKVDLPKKSEATETKKAAPAEKK